MGEGKGGKAQCHLSTQHLLTYSSYYVVLVLKPYLYLLQRCSHSPPILLSSSGILHHSKSFLGSEERTVLFLGYLRSGQSLDETVLVPVRYTPDKCFSLSLLPPRIWNQEKRIPRLLDPAKLFPLPRAWTRSTRAHVSCLATLPPGSPPILSLPTTPLLSVASQEAHGILWQVCLGWQRGVRVMEKR